jgi:hypothetical protein
LPSTAAGCAHRPSWPRSTVECELDEQPDQVRKIRSYAFDDEDDTVGTICMYQAVSPEAIRDHAAAADLTVTTIDRITGIGVQRPDPDPLTT